MLISCCVQCCISWNLKKESIYRDIVSPEGDLVSHSSATENCPPPPPPPPGHGFKLAPVVGKMLSELVLDLPLSYDLSPFHISRFSKEDM